jgi:hypothetical protein
LNLPGNDVSTYLDGLKARAVRGSNPLVCWCLESLPVGTGLR